MTLPRRDFTFASLALALGATARAAGPQQAPAEPPAPALEPTFALTRDGDELRVALTLTNRSEEAVEVLFARGSRPGPDLQARLEVDGESIALPEAMEVQLRELVSRMGPIPRWEALAAGERREVATWRFALPAGVVSEPVGLSLRVDTDRGPVVRVQSGLRWDARAGS